jgi:hypothetical protein
LFNRRQDQIAPLVSDLLDMRDSSRRACAKTLSERSSFVYFNDLSNGDGPFLDPAVHIAE